MVHVIKLIHLKKIQCQAPLEYQEIKVERISTGIHHKFWVTTFVGVSKLDFVLK